MWSSIVLMYNKPLLNQFYPHPIASSIWRWNSNKYDFLFKEHPAHLIHPENWYTWMEDRCKMSNRRMVLNFWMVHPNLVQQKNNLPSWKPQKANFIVSKIPIFQFFFLFYISNSGFNRNEMEHFSCKGIIFSVSIGAKLVFKQVYKNKISMIINSLFMRHLWRWFEEAHVARGFQGAYNGAVRNLLWEVLSLELTNKR